MPRIRIARSRAAGVTAVVALTAGLPLGLAAAPAVASTNPGACGPQLDTVAPQVSKVTFSSTSIDATHAAQQLHITADVTDTAGSGVTPSGVRRVTLFLNGPRTFRFATLALASGTATSGSWEGTIDFPTTSRSGTYRVVTLDAIDHDGNDQEYDGYSRSPNGPNDISLQPGWNSSVTVTGNGPANGKPERASGQLQHATIAPTSVDTRHATRRLKVDAVVSGRQPRYAWTFLNNFRTRSHRKFYLRIRLHRGAAGHWQGSGRVPQWLGHTSFTPTVSLSFGAGFSPRHRDYSGQELSNLGVPKQIHVISGIDTTPPTLTGLQLDSSSVDTTSGDATVNVTATATDQRSGVKSVEVSASVANQGEGEYRYSYVSSRLRQVGNHWEGTLTFHRCAAAGTWQLSAYAVDTAGNGHFLNTKRLVRAGLPSSISVTSNPGDAEPPYVTGSTASGADSTITLDFDAGVRNVTTSTLTVYAMQPDDQRFQQSQQVSAIVCSDGHATVDCAGDQQPVTSAVLTVSGLSAGSEYQVWSNLDAITPQLTDVAGNPLDWNYEVADVTAS